MQTGSKKIVSHLMVQRHKTHQIPEQYLNETHSNNSNSNIYNLLIENDSQEPQTLAIVCEIRF